MYRVSKAFGFAFEVLRAFDRVANNEKVIRHGPRVMFRSGSFAKRCHHTLPEVVRQLLNEIDDRLHELYYQRLQIDGMLYTQGGVLAGENLMPIPVKKNIDAVGIFTGIGNDCSLSWFSLVEYHLKLQF